MAGKRDYYEVLGVDRDADAQTIKKAYRKLAIKYHPDRNKDPGAADTFKEVSEAYAILSDDEKRSRYDRLGHAGIDQQYSTEDIFRNVNFEDIFGGAFGGGGGFGSIFDMFFGGSGGRGGGPARGRDLQVTHTVTLEEAYRGVEAQVNYSRLDTCGSCGGDGAEPGSEVRQCGVCGGQGQVRQQQRTPFGVIQQVGACPECRGSGRTILDPCRTCRGSGHEREKKTVSVNIPAGIDDGRRIRWPGGGEVGGRGGPHGDLFVEVRIKDHPVFLREGADLVTQRIISFPQAALGTHFELERFGENLAVDVPPGAETGHVIRLPGQGMPYLRGSGHGDILVHIHVDTPKKLSGRAKELLQDLAEEIGDPAGKPSKKGLFDRLWGN